MKFTDFLKTENLTESEIKFQALNTMKEIQQTLSALSFLDVIALMKEDNPLKKNVHDLENTLHKLTTDVGQFINDNMEDAVDITQDDRAKKVDQGIKDAEDEEEIAKKSPKPKE